MLAEKPFNPLWSYSCLRDSKFWQPCQIMATMHTMLLVTTVIIITIKVFLTQNLVPRDYSKCVHTHTHTHTGRGTCTNKHSDHTKLKNIHSSKIGIKHLEDLEWMKTSEWNSSSSSSTNWILMSCQPHRVTSGQSNLGHKQTHISKLFSHIYQPSVKSVYKTNHFTNKTYIHKHQTQIFKDLVPSILPLLKEHIRLGHAGIVDHSV